MPTRSDWEPAHWNAYVRAHPSATYLQTTAWARVKRSTGWAATNVGADGPPGERFGGLLLTRPIPLLPWRFAYAPRGPLADEWNDTTHLAWAEALRQAAADGGRLAGTAIVRMDPEIEEAEPVRRALEVAGWRRAPDMQPHRTRIVDLGDDEDALWSDLRKKWRQYVNKARSNGIAVRDVDPATEPDAFEKSRGERRCRSVPPPRFARSGRRSRRPARAASCSRRPRPAMCRPCCCSFGAAAASSSRTAG